MNRPKRRASFSPGKRQPKPKPAADDPSLSSKMKVVVRVRPQTESELTQRSLVKTIGRHELVFDPKEDVQPFYFQGKKQTRRDINKRQNRALPFTFDRVFDAQSTNDDVFEDTTKGILSSLLEGYNCSVFVYGATGAGKTFTMLGCEGTPGITYLTMVELYRRIAEESAERTFDVWVSYMEVYNENVRDLLKPKSNVALALRDDGNAGVNVAGLEVVIIHSADELLALLAQGNMSRTQHPTDANAESSRSHAIFQVHISITNRRTGERKVVKLSMIDLAGSERASASGCKGMRFKEGANINKSLLSLGNCINGLADGLKHIPYRDSKLTRILKDSLGGNCNTIMIANVSPNVNSFEDTYNTLKYATRAKKIKSKLKRNIVSVTLPAAQYQAIIKNLEDMLAESNAKLKKFQEEAVIPAAAAPTAPAAIKTDTCMESAKIVEKLQSLYEDKTRYHSKIMDEESKVQGLKYQCSLKIGDAEALGALSMNCSDIREELKKMYSAMDRYKLQIATLENDLEKVWAQERSNDEALNKVSEADVNDKDLKIFELELNKVEAECEIRHLHKMLSIQYDRLKYQEKYSKKVAKSAAANFRILDGMGKVTEQMKREYMEFRHMIAMSKKVRWGQAHEREHQSPPTEDLPLHVPPVIGEFCTLSFARIDRPSPGNPRNISQLYSGEKGSTISPYTSRLMNSYNTFDEFIQNTVGEEHLDTSFSEEQVANKVCPRMVDFEQAFSPVLPVATVFNTTVDVPPRRALLSPKRAPLNSTFDCGSIEDISVMNDAFVGGDSKHKTFNVDKLNGTFVLHNIEGKKPEQNKPEIKKPTLKRPLPTLAIVPCNKENKFKAPNAALLRALRLPGPKVPKVPKLISPRSEKRTIPQTPNPLRTPLRTVNGKTIPAHSASKAKKPFVVAKDVTPASRQTKTLRHPQFRTNIKNT